LGQLVGGDWDRVVIASAFTKREEVDALAGTELPRHVSSSVEITEDYQLLVFLRGQDVVTWTTMVRYGRDGADFQAVADQSHARDDTTFDVRRDAEGNAHLVVPGAASRDGGLSHVASRFPPLRRRSLPPPPTRAAPQNASLVWTGEEVVAIGSNAGLRERLVGAAYNPSSRRWRALDVPIPAAVGYEGNNGSQAAVWSGDRVVVLANALGSGLEPIDKRGVVLSYDPTRDEWQRLPDAPVTYYHPNVQWTGDSVIVYGAEVYVLGEKP
jgi:hypothetical protein